MIKRTVKCDIGTVQCDNRMVKCEKKKKGTTKCDKRTIKCDVRTVQYDDGIVKCEKKVRELLNVRKKRSHVMLELYNVRMEPSSMRKK